MVMVWTIFFRVLAPEITFWLVEILQQPIRSFYLHRFQSSKKNGSRDVQGQENHSIKWCQKLFTDLFEVTFEFRVWIDVIWNWYLVKIAHSLNAIIQVPMEGVPLQ